MRIMSNYFPQTMALRMGNRYHVPLFPEKLAGHVSDQKAGVEATKTAVGALAGAKGKDAKGKALAEVNKQVGLLKGHTKDIAQQLNKIKKDQ